MLGIRTAQHRKLREEGEKPFWISFSDLMSALMVLFLVAMTVALMAITDQVESIRQAGEPQVPIIESKPCPKPPPPPPAPPDTTAAERAAAQREVEIDQLMARIHQIVHDYPGVTIRGRSIDFGERASFDTNSHRLLPEQEALLRSFVPQILRIARDPMGDKWFKRVVVEGFADQRGTYLHNLNLSMQRSQRVLCVLLAPRDANHTLSAADRLKVRELFLVGGSSFNALKDTLEESRRIEFKLEFLELEEQRIPLRWQVLDETPRCPLDVGI